MGPVVRKRPRKIERVPLRIPSIVAWLIIALCSAQWCAAQVAAPDTTVAADTTAATSADTTTASAASPDSTHAPAPADSLHSFSVTDSLGVPGTLKGQTTYNPEEVRQMLNRMSTDEIPGKTTWERKKNGKVAMLCSAVFPGLGQTYNGRRLKVGLMVGVASFYMGRMILNWKYYEATQAHLDTLDDPLSYEYRQTAAYRDYYKEEARTYLWWSGAVWLVGILDSWIDAHLYDVREFTPPSPPDAVVPSPAGGKTSYLTVGFGMSRKKAP